MHPPFLPVQHPETSYHSPSSPPPVSRTQTFLSSVKKSCLLPIQLSLFLIFLFSFLAHSASAKYITAPIEVRNPKFLQPGSSKGFHRTIVMHDPYEPNRPVERFHDVQLHGGMVAVGEYYVKVKIGGQELRVQIDTGSATLAAPLKQCTDCKRGDQRYSLEQSNSDIAEYISCDHEECESNTCGYGCDKCSSLTNACCSKSNNSNCAFHLNFGDGSGAKGMLVRDIFEWGDLKFPVTFGGIASDSPDFERKEVDGILGMAYKSLACNPSCVLPTFDAMIKEYKENQNEVMKDMFSICITYDSGKLILGDYDSELSSQKTISWIPLHLSSPPTFYSFPVKTDLLVDDKPLSLPNYHTAIVDSGTTLIVFAENTFKKFKNYLLTNYCNVPGLCPGGNGEGDSDDTWFKAAHCTRLRDKDRKKLPTITFQLEGLNLEMGPSDYLINYASKGPEFWCVGIMSLGSMSGGVDVILGNTVMKKYVTIYDRENSRVGFTLSDTNCGLPGSGNEDYNNDNNDDDDSGVSGQGQTGGSSDEDDDDDDNKDNTKGNDQACEKAVNCSECIKVSETSCKWDVNAKTCISGSALPWMCKLEELESNAKLFIGGAIAFVVVVIIVVAIVVTLVRKRRDASLEDDSESEIERPLATDEQNENSVDTRGAFAIEDDEDDSRI